MKITKTFFTYLLLYLSTQYKIGKDRLYAILFLGFRYPLFRKIEWHFFKRHLFLSPYRECAQFMKCYYPEKDPYVYGETPIAALQKMQQVFSIDTDSTVLELGSGTGRSAFWFALTLGIPVYAVEQVPVFVQQALKWKYRYQISNLHFYMGSFLSVPWPSSTTHIYFYGTGFADEIIFKVIEKIKKETPQAHIITVSYSLEEYDASFKVIKAVEVSFFWGEGTVFLQRLKN